MAYVPLIAEIVGYDALHQWFSTCGLWPTGTVGGAISINTAIFKIVVKTSLTEI